MSISTIISRCVATWRTEGIPLEPAIPEDEIRRVWASLDRRLSSDVLTLYTIVGGFEDYAWFDERFFWSLWPLDWLIKRNRESPRVGMMFCDHSIEIVTWELRYETAEYSSVWSSHGDQSAPTLEVFFERYLENPWQLL